MKKICGNCVYFENGESGISLCHRFPPPAFTSGFVKVGEASWCGGHEEKISSEAEKDQGRDKMSFFKKRK